MYFFCVFFVVLVYYVLCFFCVCFFTLLEGLFYLINLSIFLLWLLDLNIVIKTFPTPRYQINSATCSSITFMVSFLHLKFLSIMWMHDMRYGFNFIFFQMVTQTSQHHLIKKNSSMSLTWDATWTFSSIPLIYLSVYLPILQLNY